jgi:two-component system response regulator NreC
MIKKELPGTQIIIVTMDMRPELIMESIEAGISGIVPKQAAEIELLSAITDVKNGLTHMTSSFPAVKNANIRQKAKRKEKKKHTRHKILTDREIEIISFLAMGFHVSEIAEKLVISVRTVGAHKSNIFRKCKVHSTPELMRFALRNKIIEF